METALSRLPGIKGGIMKRLTISTAFMALIPLVLVPLAIEAGEWDSHFSAGPSLTSMGELTTVVARFDAILQVLNDYFEEFPAEVRGVVPPIRRIGGGVSVIAGERYWLWPGFALGIATEFSHSRDGTSGVYQSRERDYAVDVHVEASLLGAALDVQAIVLDAGIRLGVGIRLGYYLARLDVLSSFEVPQEYPDQLAGIPPDLEDRFTGGAFGGEFAFVVSYPIAPWLTARAEAIYRVVPAQLANTVGDQLDFDGNGTPERISLGGFAVRLGFSLRLDLSG